MTASAVARAARAASPARAWAWVLGGLSALSILATIPLSLLSHQNPDGLIALTIGIPAAMVGLVVAWRLPGNPLGWLQLAVGTCLLMANDGSDYALLAYRLGYHLPFGVLALFLNQLWGPAVLALGLVILLFPDGRLTSRISVIALWAYCTVLVFEVVALGAATAQAVFGRVVRVDSTGGLAATDKPVGWYATADHAPFLVVLAFVLIFVARQVLGWRGSTGETRQQLKWLASGAAFTVACAVIAFASNAVPIAWLRDVLGAFWFGFAALPISIGVGILKYRLYEIDRLISRTLSYTLVTGLLVGVYAGLVLLASHVLEFTGPVTVAVSTLIAAALFAPVRRRVQRAVDRKFNRAKYNADRTVATFAADLKDAVDLDTIRDDLATVVRATLEPAHVSVWLTVPQSSADRDHSH